MDENKYFGKQVVITGEVVCNNEDEDLKLYRECCDHVMKMYVEIQKEHGTLKDHV